MEGKKSQPQSDATPRADIIKIANELRSKANKMTDEQREAAFRHGMQLIYGGHGGCVTAKTRGA